MKSTVTPLLRSNIGNRLGKVPVVAVKVLGIVLPLSIRMILRFRQNDGPVLPRAFAMANGIFDTNLNALRMVRRHISFADGEATLPCLHLDPMIGNAQANGETKSL